MEPSSPSAKTTLDDKHLTAPSSLPYSDNDVLIGRFKFCRENGGTRFLRRLVEQRFIEHEIADRWTDYTEVGLKKNKDDIKKEIIAAIKANGGRFLQINSKTRQCEGEVSDVIAQKKVVDIFKSVRKQVGVGFGDLADDVTHQSRMSDEFFSGFAESETNLFCRMESDSTLSWSVNPSVVDETLSIEQSLASGRSRNTANEDQLSADETTMNSLQSSKASSQDTNVASKSTQSSTATSKLSWQAGSSVLSSKMSIESEFSQLRSLSPVRESQSSLDRYLTESKRGQSEWREESEYNDNFSAKLDMSESFPSSSENSVSEDVRAEVEALVRIVIPEEIKNIDSMLAQFHGREEELLQCIKTIQRRRVSARARLHKSQRQASPEERGSACARRQTSASRNCECCGSDSRTENEYTVDLSAHPDETASPVSESSVSVPRKQEIRAEVEALVRIVIREEINIDATMEKFRGREEELLQTARAMQERTSSARARAAVHKSKGRQRLEERRNRASAPRQTSPLAR